MKQRSTTKGCPIVTSMNYKNETGSKPGKTLDDMIGAFESTVYLQLVAI